MVIAPREIASRWSEWKKEGMKGGRRQSRTLSRQINSIYSSFLPRKTTTSLSSATPLTPLYTLRTVRTAQLPHFVNEPGMLNY